VITPDPPPAVAAGPWRWGPPHPRGILANWSQETVELVPRAFAFVIDGQGREDPLADDALDIGDGTTFAIVSKRDVATIAPSPLGKLSVASRRSY
jgi:hypothetical protein